MYKRQGYSFVALAVFLASGVTAIFTAMYPDVLPSTLDPAYSLTVESASSSDYTLGVMTWVAVIFVPIVLAYQGWTYWVFRRRLQETHIPESHVVTPV